MYKTVKELTHDQLDELRWNTFYKRNDGRDDTIDSPDSTTDETLYVLYEDVSFTDDDFFCTAGKGVK